MPTITVVAAKARLSALLAEVRAGEELVITRRGPAVARIMPEPDAAPATFDMVELFAFVDSQPIHTGPDAHEFLLASRWVVTEFSSALPLKVRTGTITEPEQVAALAMLRRFGVTRLRRLDVEAKDFDTASNLCDQIAAPLRAGDALHLAVCKRTGARLAKFDEGMATAAKQHGLPCDLLSADRR